MADRYIWIVRWDDFQHYAPERDRAPAWIKNYTKQLDDERYTGLTPRRRALLTDLRLVFARTSQQLRYDSRTLSARLLSQVRDDDIQALVYAGFIEIISRATLDQRLDEFYKRSRANSRPRGRPRPHGEVEEEEEHPHTPSQTRRGNDRITQKELRRYTGCRMTRGTHGFGWKHDPLGTDKPPPDWPHDRPTLDEVLAARAQAAVPVHVEPDDEIGF